MSISHSFDVSIAEKYGLEESIILNNIYFWLEKNAKNNKNFYDGEYWTYNSVKAFEEQFPYITTNKIRRAINSLIENKIIKKGNYNKNPYDRTAWYALDTVGYAIFNLTNTFVNITNHICEYNKCTNVNLTNVYTDTITNNNTDTITNTDDFSGDSKNLDKISKKQNNRKSNKDKNKDLVWDVIDNHKTNLNDNIANLIYSFYSDRIDKGEKISDMQVQIQLDEFVNKKNNEILEAVKNAIAGGYKKIYLNEKSSYKKGATNTMDNSEEDKANTTIRANNDRHKIKKLFEEE